MKKRPVRILPTQVEWLVTPLAGRHWAVLAVAFVGSALILLGLLTWLFPSPRVPTEALPYLAKDRFDDRVYAQYQAQKSHGKTVDIMVFGTSSAREALWEMPPNLEVLDLSANGQTFLEALYLLDIASGTQAQQMAILLSPRNLVQDLSHAKQMLATRYFHDPVGFAAKWRQQVPLLAGDVQIPEAARLSFLAYQNVLLRFLKQGMKHWFSEFFYGIQLPGHQRYRYSHIEPGNIERQQEHRAKVRTRFESKDPAVIRANLNLLRHLIEAAQRRGMQVMLFETPRMEGDLERLYGPFWREYSAHIAALSEQYRVPYIDLNHEVLLGPADFADSIHTAQSGRDRWSPVFFKTLRSMRTPPSS